MLLRVTNLKKTYARVEAVKDLNFEIQQGEIFALLGPNGAGKTTTVRMLIGLSKPDSGSIDYMGGDGQTHQSVPPQDLGYLPEERGLYLDQPVHKQLVYFAGLRGIAPATAAKSASEWLERLSLSDRAKEKVSSLSKGNQQKVQLIAAILHQPRFAILDEPFSGFDPLNQELAMSMIREMREAGTTVLLSAHQMDLVERLADRVLLINSGQAVRHGTLAQLRSQEGLSQKLSLEFAEPANITYLQSLAGVVSVESLSATRASLLLADDANFNELMAGLSKGARIQDVRSDAIGLHEIYLRAVGPQEQAKP